jgi:hypothetical protein
LIATFQEYKVEIDDAAQSLVAEKMITKALKHNNMTPLR